MAEISAQGRTERLTAAGTATRRYSAAPEPPIFDAGPAADHTDRVIAQLSRTTHGAPIRLTLYLYGLGLPMSKQVELRGIGRKKLENYLEAGLTAVEFSLLIKGG